MFGSFGANISPQNLNSEKDGFENFAWSGGEGGFNWSGVDPPLSLSRACLMAFIANSVP